MKSATNRQSSVATTAHGHNASQQRSRRREHTDHDNGCENWHDHTPLIYLVKAVPFDPLDLGHLST
jgi:hypothetical protein